MARFPSDKPAKPIVEETRPETEVNQDDPNLEISINPIDWNLVPNPFSWLGNNDESGKVDNDFERFDDEGIEMVQDEEEEEEGVNVISDLETSDESRSTTEEDFLMNGTSQPIGVVISVKGEQVIVEGKENHNNLVSKGSFLCLPETMDPLGFVDEICGTLEKPCYSVRLKSESQMIEWISEGTQVSLILVGCLEHGDDEIEFSDDDEEEAEYRKMQKKMAKTRRSNERKTGNTKNKKKGNISTRRMYTHQDFSNDEDYINQCFGVPIDEELWPELNTNSFAPQDLPSRGRGGRGFRGGGRGFRGRGQDQFPSR